jgi:hypothetical protein
MFNNAEHWVEQAMAFQRIWLESSTRMVRAFSTSYPDSSPPELARLMRGDFMQGMTEAWNRVLRSPEFLKTMKEWTDNSIVFRKQANDWLARIRNDSQSPSLDDVDDILTQLRQSERRVLDQMGELTERLTQLETKNGRHSNGNRRTTATAQSKRRKTRTTQKRSA